MEEKTFITQEGLDHLVAELQNLKTAKRREIADRIQAAKELGDLSENAEYHEAKEEQAFMEGKIVELEYIIKTAQVIKKKNSGKVEVGSTVCVKSSDGKERTFAIMGPQEADPAGGTISNESPMGKAFLGRKKGDSVKVVTPRAVQEYTILSIR